MLGDDKSDLIVLNDMYGDFWDINRSGIENDEMPKNVGSGNERVEGGEDFDLALIGYPKCGQRRPGFSRPDVRI